MLRFLLFSLLLLPLPSFALYIGNPSAPMMPEVGAFIPKEDWFGVKVSYICDYVYDQSVRARRQQIAGWRKNAKDFNALSQFGVITFNFNDRVEIFGNVGAMECGITHHPFSDTKISYQTTTDFAWGVGGRAILAYWRNLQLAANAAYVKSEPNLSTLKVNGTSYPTQRAELEFTEWQIGVGLSYRLDWFIPYIGFDYANFRANVKHLNSIAFLIPSKYVTFKDHYPCGMYLGFGLSAYRAVSLNVEARFINENAISVSADFKF